MEELVSAIDKLLEQLEVPTEPVKSGMMAAVGSRLSSIWSDARYSKYDNLTDDQLVALVGEDKTKLIRNAEKAKAGIEKAKTAKSSNAEDLKAAGVTDKVAAIITPSSKTNIATPTAKLVEAASAVLQAILWISANNPGMTAEALVKNVIKAVKGKTNLPATEINKIIAIISQDDAALTGFIETAGKKGIAAAAAELEKGPTK